MSALQVFGAFITDTEGGRWFVSSISTACLGLLAGEFGWSLGALVMRFKLYTSVIGVKAHPKQVYVESQHTHLSYRYSHISITIDLSPSACTDQLCSLFGRLTSRRGLFCRHLSFITPTFHSPRFIPRAVVPFHFKHLMPANSFPSYLAMAILVFNIARHS